ncbi:hypothetical protein E4U32_006387 [Claviceps aff. humidiphila group G2b]|nr:hypothetical protein E4U32_006387 [Claviceps aff. humidiphila group G2b]
MDGTYQPPQLPYFAPQSRLPIPIPAVQDIEREAVVLLQRTSCRVVRYGNHFVIKYGLRVSLTEGENILFVRHTQPLLAPEVFALFSVETDRGLVNYIIMENVVGDGLDQVWATLYTPEKCRIAGELRLQIEALRQIPAPGYFGCIGRRPFEENMFWTAPGQGLNDGTVNGPFEAQSELNEALVRKYLHNSGRDQDAQADYYRRVLPLVLHGHDAVFTHGDLQLKNIILKPDGQPVIVDWETAGWYPAYWEFASATIACLGSNQDWFEYIPRVMEAYTNECAWHDRLRSDTLS